MREPDDEVVSSMVDLVFPLMGRTLPRDHRLALAQALGALVPWLGDEPGSGIHPVNLVHSGGDPALLSQRARLVVRMPRPRVDEAATLAGCTLDVAGHAVRLGTPHARDLLAHNTLYAHLVVADIDAAPGGEEAAFLAAVNAELAALGVPGQPICGRRHLIRGAADDGAPLLAGYSLMLHGLSQAPARRLLEAGVGTHRRLGCGIFVAHRSAAAVGA